MAKREFTSQRAPIYTDVPDEKWNSWRWQLSNRLNTAEELSSVLELTSSEQAALSKDGLLRVEVTPYFISLIDPNNPYDPIRPQVIPTENELVPFESMMADSLAEDKHSPVPGLVHRYPDRVLMMITTTCASYCRYCTRSRIVGDDREMFNRAEYDAQIDYLERTPQVRDVLISGGDPLAFPPKLLQEIIERLRAIKHIEIIRIGSRVPVFMPQRVDDEFCEMLSNNHPVWMNIHINHSNEITVELAEACNKLTRAGVPLGNQTVLLAGINDSVHIQRQLAHDLVRMRVRPYYLYQCDLVPGAGHFRTSVSKGIEIIEGMRGHTSGYAVPQFAIDAPGGGGKVPINPNYVLSQTHNKIVLRNFEGYISTYAEPEDYDPRVVEPLEQLIEPRSEPGQEGIAALLAGKRLHIAPEGFEDLHTRGHNSHRLRDGDVSKWQPLGIGEPPDLLEAERDNGKLKAPAKNPDSIDSEISVQD